MYLKNNSIIIHDGNRHLWETPTVDGDEKKHGLIPRDYTKHPVGCYEGIKPYTAVDMKLVPRSDWSAIIKHKNEARSWLTNLRDRGNKGKPIPSRDQNGYGYCWAHSGVSAHLLHRAKLNLPYADLSAYMIACIIKNFRDQGGWGAAGLDFQFQKGCATSKTWPQQSTNRANVNDAMYKEAAKYKTTGAFVDLQAAVYDRTLSWDQQVTCLLMNNPTIDDYNFWSHSVGGAAIVDGVSLFNEGIRNESGKIITIQEFHTIWDMNDPVTAGMGKDIWNSWGDGWSRNGVGTLPPNKAVADGCAAITDTVPTEDETPVTAA